MKKILKLLIITVFVSFSVAEAEPPASFTYPISASAKLCQACIIKCQANSGLSLMEAIAWGPEAA